MPRAFAGEEMTITRYTATLQPVEDLKEILTATENMRRRFETQLLAQPFNRAESLKLDRLNQAERDLRRWVELRLRGTAA
jgi:hypothetical protein